jgi:hypothetical protein
MSEYDPKDKWKAISSEEDENRRRQFGPVRNESPFPVKAVFVVTLTGLAIAAGVLIFFQFPKPGNDTPLGTTGDKSVQESSLSSFPDASQTEPAPELDIPGLLSRLDLGGEARQDATSMLSRYATEEHLDALHEGIGRIRNGAARGRVAMVLGKIGSELSNYRLMTLLEKDSSQYARRGAAYALGLIGSSSSVSSLKNALMTDANDEVKYFSAFAIGQILGPDAANVFKEASTVDQSPRVRSELERLANPDRMGTRAPKLTPGRAATGVLNDGEYLVYIPSSYTSKKKWPVVVSVHARFEPWQDFEKMWRVESEKYGFIVLAPHFDAVKYPQYEYMVGLQGSSDAHLLNILDELGKVVSIQADQVYMFGHSTGGRFVSAFTFLYPERVRMAAIAGSNGFTSADPKTMFTAGIRPNPNNRADLIFDMKKVFDTPMAVLLRKNDRESRKKEATKFMASMRDYGHQIRAIHKAKIIEMPESQDKAALYELHAAKYFFDNR